MHGDAVVTVPPAEKAHEANALAARCRSRRHASRTYFTAARPSATRQRIPRRHVVLQAYRVLLAIISVVPSLPVRTSRYFSTKPVTPLSLSHFATSTPSLLIDRTWNPPPGQMMTAVPLAAAGSGR